MERTERPTLVSVARRAQVSRQTVSNVINAPGLVHPATLARVQAVIDEVGYRPHQAGRQLRTRRSRVLGLRLEPVRDGINGAVLDRFMHALTEHAQAYGYRVMLFTAADDAQEIDRYAELLDTADLDGFVLTSTHHDDRRTEWLAERGVPFVTFGRPWAAEGDVPEHPWVDVDGAAGTRAAVEHLRALGHTRIGFLGWPSRSGVGDDRRAGWAEAMAGIDLAPGEPDRLAVAVPDGVAAGTRAAERLLATVAPTAFVCASDSLALGALTTVRSRSLGTAVVGFDDTPVAAAVGLSSVAQPLAEAAARAVNLLLDRIEHPTTDVADPHVMLTPHLEVRASSTPAP